MRAILWLLRHLESVPLARIEREIGEELNARALDAQVGIRPPGRPPEFLIIALAALALAVLIVWQTLRHL